MNELMTRGAGLYKSPVSPRLLRETLYNSIRLVFLPYDFKSTYLSAQW